jgi:adenine-specific DNA-methyltransferase
MPDPESATDEAPQPPQEALPIDRYAGWTQEDLIAELRQRDALKHLGIVWDRNRVEADRALSAPLSLPAIDPTLSSNASGPWRHLIIEGDNIDALRALSLVQRGRVDCIFIDPPYNTGSRDFVYNDRFVDKRDSWRQSKWLEFLYHRLRLGAGLLAPTGVMFVCINDENRDILGMLLEKVMPGQRLGTFAWRSRAGAGTTSKTRNFSADHEHIFVYGGAEFEFKRLPKDLSNYSNVEGDDRWAPDNLTKTFTYIDRPASYFPLHDEERDIWFPCNPERVWGHVWSDEETRGGISMQRLLSQNKVLFPKNPRTARYDTLDDLYAAIDRGDVPTGDNGNLFLRPELPGIEDWVGRTIGWGTPLRKKYVSELKSTELLISSWLRPATEADTSVGEPDDLLEEDDEEEGSGEVAGEDDSADASGTIEYGIREGGRTLTRIFGRKVFNNPKPESLVRGLIRQACPASGVVLDFFAGSGTTGHAVIKLNAEDGGSRRFILVSNTEATPSQPDKNLCRDVCAERIRRVINGYGRARRAVPGIPTSFAYASLKPLDWSMLPYDPPAEAIWVLAQLECSLSILPYDAALLVQSNGPLAFVPSATDAAIEALQRLKEPPSLIWTASPARVADLFPSASITNSADFIEAATVVGGLT